MSWRDAFSMTKAKSVTVEGTFTPSSAYRKGVLEDRKIDSVSSSTSRRKHRRTEEERPHRSTGSTGSVGTGYPTSSSESSKYDGRKPNSGSSGRHRRTSSLTSYAKGSESLNEVPSRRVPHRSNQTKRAGTAAPIPEESNGDYDRKSRLRDAESRQPRSRFRSPFPQGSNEELSSRRDSVLGSIRTRSESPSQPLSAYGEPGSPESFDERKAMGLHSMHASTARLPVHISPRD